MYMRNACESTSWPATAVCDPLKTKNVMHDVIHDVLHDVITEASLGKMDWWGPAPLGCDI